jgi:uncharacterized protein
LLGKGASQKIQPHNVGTCRVGAGFSTMQIPINFDQTHVLSEQFRQFVQAAEFPCVGAKAALARKQMDFIVCRQIASAWDDLRIMPALLEVIRRYRADRTLFRTFVVLFENDEHLSEEVFERHLWERLQSLSDKDDWLGFKPDPAVDVDPISPHFGLSFGGEAFFVVGLHPGASRPARQFLRPAMVFNMHDQFEVLRKQNKYERLREAIIDRDIAVNGDANPMLARHGTLSEAHQYSGRAVTEDWECPYRRQAA